MAKTSWSIAIHPHGVERSPQMREILLAMGVPERVTVEREGDSLTTKRFIVHDLEADVKEGPAWLVEVGQGEGFGDRLATFVPAYLAQKAEEKAAQKEKSRLVEQRAYEKTKSEYERLWLALPVALIAAEGVPREFKREDWYGWAGAEAWDTGEQPWILEMPFRGDVSKDLELGQMGHGYMAEFGVNTQYMTAIADAEGVGIHFTSEDGDQGPMFYKTMRLEPEEAEGALKAVARHLKSGRLPSGYQHIN